MTNAEAKTLEDLAMTCALACVTGQPTVTITISRHGLRPPGFPRGELLSENQDGLRNYACHPVKVLAWLHARTSKTPNAAHQRNPTARAEQTKE